MVTEQENASPVTEGQPQMLLTFALRSPVPFPRAGVVGWSEGEDLTHRGHARRESKKTERTGRGATGGLPSEPRRGYESGPN